MALIDNLVSYWKFDESAGTDIDDAHGDNDGTAYNIEDADWVAGKINNALNFDAAGVEYAVIPHDNSLNTTTAVSISVWIKLSSLGTYQSFFSKGRSSLTGVNYMLRITNANYLQFVFYTGGFVIHTDTQVEFTTGQWYHIVVTYDQSNVRFYVNGAAKDAPAETTIMTTNSEVVHMARWGDPFLYYNGVIDELGVWNRALTAPEVTALWNDGNGLAYPFVPVTNMQINIADVWKDADSIQINIGDVWKDVVQVLQNIGNVWKTVFG